MRWVTAKIPKIAKTTNRIRNQRSSAPGPLRVLPGSPVNFDFSCNSTGFCDIPDWLPKLTTLLDYFQVRCTDTLARAMPLMNQRKYTRHEVQRCECGDKQSANHGPPQG